ncbi:MAG: hypothetical protein PHP74_00010 [Candidatus Gracilibacteria bacterium]|nr:hypothetical protein [Candidatus Gracilibacteria bacterium]
MKFRYNLLALAAFCTVLFAPNAYAYLDAGTGSQIIQIIIAGSVGAIFAFKVYFKKIKLFFQSKYGKKTVAQVKPAITPEAND